MSQNEANVWQPRHILDIDADNKSVTESLLSLQDQSTFYITEFAYALSTGALSVHKNGLLLNKGVDWIEQTTTSFSTTVACDAGDILIATGMVGITGDVIVRDTDIFIANLQLLRDYTGIEITIYVQGSVSQVDGGESMYGLITGAAPGFYVDDGDEIIVPTGGNGSAAWLKQPSEDKRLDLLTHTTLASLKAAELEEGNFTYAFFSGDEKAKNTRQLYLITAIVSATNGPLTDDSQIIELDSGLFAVAVQTLGDSNVPFSLTRLNMHFGALKGIPWNATESGGTVEFASSSPAEVGDMSLSLVSATGLVPNMLICYLADDGQYYSTVIESIAVNVLSLRTPIESTLASAGRVFNFYNNSSHANARGFYAITDYALRDIRYNLSRVISVPVTDWIQLIGPETVTTSTDEDIFAPGSTDVPYAKVVTTAATQGAVTLGSYSLPQGQYLIRGFINTGATNSAQLAILEKAAISGAESQVAVTTLEGDDTTQVFELIYYARNNSTQRIAVKTVGAGAQEMEIGVVEVLRIDGLATNPDNSKHVMLGDSWFAQGHIQTRITDRLPNAVIFNEGFGGNRAADLIPRFDSDVTPHKPDYVWIMTGTNDFFQNETLDEFEFSMNVLKNKIVNIGAIPIVFDPAVGEIDGVNAAHLNMSRQYANYGSYNLEALRLLPDAPAPVVPTVVSFFVRAVSVPASSTLLVYIPPGTSELEYTITRSFFTSGTVNVAAGFATGIAAPTEDVQSYVSNTLIQPSGAITITKAVANGRFVAIGLENPSGGALVVSGYIELSYIPTT